jgi:hypothetical protein
MFMEKTICENGVPAVEVGRVISDGLMPPEATQVTKLTSNVVIVEM